MDKVLAFIVFLGMVGTAISALVAVIKITIAYSGASGPVIPFTLYVKR